MATLKSVNLSIYIYGGISGSYTDTDLKYTLQKSIISYQDNIVFEIAEIVRDYIDVNFNDEYLSKTIWVTTVANLVDDTDTIFTYGSPVTNTSLAFDGYGFYEDEINPQLTAYDLISSSTIYLPENTVGKLPVYAATTGSVVIDSVTTTITDNGNTNQKIQYIDIPANTTSIEVKDSGGTTQKTISVVNICEPKFTPYKVTFVNRYGAFQDLYFFKKTTESFNVSDEKFKRNIINSSTVTYGVNQAQQTRYNINATSSISLNTGFIKEDMNDTIEELFLSENLWIRYNGKTLPIIPTTKNLQFKTVLNDKLIDYKVDFEFAFDKINNVR
tara:strand:+ start:14266 stop:15252 length:987 start_codon:yes stop_codon:yes gene_type:complete